MENQLFNWNTHYQTHHEWPCSIAMKRITQGGTAYYVSIVIPRCSMYGIFTYIYPKNGPNVGKYSSTMEHMDAYGIFYDRYRNVWSIHLHHRHATAANVCARGQRWWHLQVSQRPVRRLCPGRKSHSAGTLSMHGRGGLAPGTLGGERLCGWGGRKDCLVILGKDSYWKLEDGILV